MKLELHRYDKQEDRVFGKLSIDGAFVCYTLEDQLRQGIKVAGATAIPAGDYRVVLTFSQRFQMILPLLLDVPNFEGIRIHSGNTEADTSGCILVGLDRSNDKLLNSRLATSVVLARVARAINVGRDEVRIVITDPPVEMRA